MKSIHVPRIDARYWAGITLASVFGTNTGDLYAHDSGLGIVGGLPILAAIVAVAYFLERRDTTRHEAWYWLAIIVIRTGATNIADYLCGRRYVGINRVALCVGLALVIAAMIWRRESSDKVDLPQTDARYWIAMLAAGVFGTAAGDAIAGALGGPRGMGGVVASLLLVLLLASALLCTRRSPVQALSYYWVTVCVARTAGTAIADMLAENADLHIGLPISTLWTGLAFVGVLLLWKSRAKFEAVAA